MSKASVLIIDDHPAMRQGIALMLEATGDLCVCAEAGSREEVLNVLDHHTPKAAIVDISLGDQQSSGMELIALLKDRLGKNFPILIYSMHDEMMYAERALKQGAHGYLMKQEPVRRILDALRTILKGDVFVSPAMSQVLLSTHVRGLEGPADVHSVDQLSQREFDVFQLLGKGLPPREIAKRLFLSVKTVETHRAKIRMKLGLDSATDLTNFAINWLHRPNEAARTE